MPFSDWAIGVTLRFIILCLMLVSCRWRKHKNIHVNPEWCKQKPPATSSKERVRWTRTLRSSWQWGSPELLSEKKNRISITVQRSTDCSPLLPATELPGFSRELLFYLQECFLVTCVRLFQATDFSFIEGVNSLLRSNPWLERQVLLVELRQQLRYSVAQLASVRWLFHQLRVNTEFKVAQKANLHLG